MRRKRCTQCGQIKLLTEFHRQPLLSGGLRRQCKSCVNHTRQVRRSNPKSRRAELQRDYLRRRTPAFRSNRNATLRQERAERSAAIEAMRGHAWLKAIKEAREENRRLDQRLLRQRDPAFRLIMQIRIAIATMLKKRGQIKSRKAFDILPYSPQELINHLKQHFLPGITLENYGMGNSGWHIDHKRPIASFDPVIFSSPDDLICEVFALSNLYPLWGKDNIRKGSSWNGRRWRIKESPAWGLRTPSH